MSDNATPHSVAQGMARLKELLFDSEVETLGELDQRLSAIEGVNESQAREQLEMLGRVESCLSVPGQKSGFAPALPMFLTSLFRKPSSASIMSCRVQWRR